MKLISLLVFVILGLTASIEDGSASVMKNLPTDERIEANAGSNEYIFLTDFDGVVMILDATSYEEVQRYNLTELTWSTRAIIDGAVYNILSSFDGGKIMKGTTQELLAGVEVNWTEAASFPPARNYVQSGAVVNGTDIYFQKLNNNRICMWHMRNLGNHLEIDHRRKATIF